MLHALGAQPGAQPRCSGRLQHGDLHAAPEQGQVHGTSAVGRAAADLRRQP